MTGRTHDLAAFTALNYVVVSSPIPQLTLSTALVAFTANMIGGLTPDIDQSTAALWRKLPAGTIFGRILSPLLGGHRFISHSILGIFLFGFLSSFILDKMSHVLLVDMRVVWWSFMIGYISHLIMDTFTKDGVPWLFPIPIKFGLPPLRFTRISTGGIVEKAFVFPVLLMANVYLIYSSYHQILDFFHSFLR